MSNGYRDWINDIITTLDAKMWEAEFLPDGWTNTFIPEMKYQLAKKIGSYIDDFVVLQVKEKYGAMRMYWSWADRDYANGEVNDLNKISKEVEYIIHKYENISEKTCVVCGKEATKMTTGWVLPMCDYCFENGV